MTSKPATLVVDRGVAVVLPLAPVPASRPRISRWGGAYYGKTYTAWMNRARELFLDIRREWLLDIPLFPTAGVMSCQEIVCHRPPTTKRRWPRGDFDNYEKAMFDAATSSGLLWKDDDQVLMNWSIKRFARKDEQPHTRLWVAECHDIPSKDDVYALSEHARTAFME